MNRTMCATLLVLAGVVFSSRADRTNVTSAAELVAVLEKWNLDGNSSHVITLAKGAYDVSAFRMQGYDPRDGGKYLNAYGHLAVTRLTLRGETDDPRDTVIYGNGQDGESPSDYLIYMWQGKLQHLTVSNGCSSAASGGGVCCMNTVTVNTNVIVTCCKAQNGGGICSGVWNNCQIIDNESTGSGGGVYRSRMVGGSVCGNSSRNESGGGAYKANLYGVVVSNNTANTHGGGVYNSDDSNGTTYEVSNCVVVCNSASSGGGVRNGIVRNSLVSGNEAQNNGGGCYDVSVYGSVLIGNTAANGGGFHSGTLCDTSVVSNQVTGAGGAGYYGTSTNCLFACNVSTGTSGGLYSGTHHGATVSNNLARCNGGGAYASTLYDSWIGFNVCSNWLTGSNERTYGGGLNGGTASNCVVVGNAIPNCPNTYRQGAGGYGTAFVDCLIANFVYGGVGSAMNGGSAVRCVISNNVGSTGAHCVRQIKAPGLVDCDIYEGTLDAQSALENCRVMNYTNGNVLAVGDNVVAQGHFKGLDYLSENTLHATNCLFANNTLPTLFRPAKAQFSLLNCTIAGNRADSTFFDTKVDSSARVVNCLFADNWTKAGTQRRDLNYGVDSEKFCNQNIVFTNCLISTYRTKNPCTDEYGTVTNDNARFDSANLEHPYSLRRASPARGKGVVMDWMADATDVRRSAEFPRLSEDGRVDIGCYQCWLEPVGALLLLR